MDNFVLGFCFTEDKNQVLLANKLRPEWQKGCLNGIGGKIEPGETPLDTMIRESIEEAGLKFILWTEIGVMRGTNDDKHKFECFIFVAFSDRVKGFKQIEDEILDLKHIDDIWYHKTVRCLEFLIPMLLCEDGMSYAELTYS